MPRKPVIVTFYSYRGGVGRTMAALNVAYLLAQRARRVLLIDMDLEAPGLTHLAERQDLIFDEEQARGARGILGAFCSFLSHPEQPSLMTSDSPGAIDDYLVRLRVEKPEDAVVDAGELYIMPAGPREGYGTSLEEFHNNARLFAAQRRDMAAKLRSVLVNSGRFDYIFIDARTGLSDEGYMASRYLCDHLVVLTGLNEQNVRGAVDFLRHVAAWKEKNEGPAKIVLVASPVCEYEDDPKAKRIEEAKKQLREVGGESVDFAVLLPYHPRLSLYEELIAVKWPGSGLGRAYRRLMQIVLSLADDSPGSWVDSCVQATQRKDIQGALEAFRRLKGIDPGEARRFGRSVLSNAAVQLGTGEAEQLLDELAKLDPSEPLHPLNRARLLRARGAKSDEVLEALGRARELAVKAGNHAVLGIIQSEEGKTLKNDKKVSARTRLEEALRSMRDLGDRRGMAAALRDLAELDRIEGNYATARERLEEALRILQKLGDKRGIAVTLHELGHLDDLEGEYPEARKKLDEALRIMRDLGDEREIAATLHGLAELDKYEGHYEEARKKLVEALHLVEKAGDMLGTAVTLSSLAELYKFKGDYAEARKRFQSALRMKTELGDKRGRAVTLHKLGELDRLEGQYAEARQKFEDALRIMRELNDKREIAVMLGSLALLDEIEGRYPEAREKYQTVLGSAKDLGAKRLFAVTLHNLGELDRRERKYAEARQKFEESLRILRQLGDKREIAVTLKSLSELDRLEEK